MPQEQQNQPTGGTPNPPPGGANPPNPGNQPPPGNDGGRTPAGGNPPPDGQRQGRGTGSIYEDIGEKEPGSKGASTWAEDWREQLATGDDGKIDQKQLDLLKRYASLKEYHKSSMAARQRISSGEYKRAAPPDGADEKAMAAWREEQGLPVKPEDYSFVEPDGKPLNFESQPEDVKTNLTALQTEMHKANFTKEQASVVNNWLNGLHMKGNEAQAKFDAEKFDANDDALRADWGPDFKINLKANLNFMDAQFGPENTDSLLTARLPDGTKLSDAPWFNKAINAIVRAANGGEVGGIFEGSSEAKSLSSRKAEIEGIMSGPESHKYWSSPAMQKEYGEILAKLPDKK